ncbi:MAG: hypothetical protein IJV31_02600 [Clostridia bacterium]|nr:hypothetical protein [Clostridia bacterium]
MAVIKAIFIFFLIFYTIGKILQALPDKDKKLELKYEIIYFLEIVISILLTIAIFKI